LPPVLFLLSDGAPIFPCPSSPPNCSQLVAMRAATSDQANFPRRRSPPPGFYLDDHEVSVMRPSLPLPAALLSWLRLRPERVVDRLSAANYSKSTQTTYRWYDRLSGTAVMTLEAPSSLFSLQRPPYVLSGHRRAPVELPDRPIFLPVDRTRSPWAFWPL